VLCSNGSVQPHPVEPGCCSGRDTSSQPPQPGQLRFGESFHFGIANRCLSAASATCYTSRRVTSASSVPQSERSPFVKPPAGSAGDPPCQVSAWLVRSFAHVKALQRVGQTSLLSGHSYLERLHVPNFVARNRKTSLP
jgi:hypothetical protein